MPDRWIFTLEAQQRHDGSFVCGVRMLLKTLLRRYGLRCVDIQEVRPVHKKRVAFIPDVPGQNVMFQ